MDNPIRTSSGPLNPPDALRPPSGPLTPYNATPVEVAPPAKTPQRPADKADTSGLNNYGAYAPAPAKPAQAAKPPQDPNQPSMPALIWDEYNVNSTVQAARDQGLLTKEQGDANADLTNKVLPDATPRQMSLEELAGVAMAAGIKPTNGDVNQFAAALAYVNGGKGAQDQRDRLCNVLNDMTVLQQHGMPKLSKVQMIADLQSVHAASTCFDDMNDKQLAQEYQKIAQATQVPGNHQFKYGRRTVSFDINQSGQIQNAKTDKKSIWATIGKVALMVGCVVPGPWMPFCIIGTAALNTAEGIKNGNWLQAAAGIASGFTAGATSFLGEGFKTAANIAGSAAKGLQATEATLAGVKSGSWAGLVSGAAGFVGAAAGGVGEFAAGAADRLNGVYQDLDKFANVARSFDSARQGDIGGALAGGLAVSGQVAGGNTGKLLDAASGTLGSATHGDWIGAVAGGLDGASQVANRGHEQDAGPQQNRLPTNLREGLKFAGQTAGVVGQLAQGDYVGAAGSGLGLASHSVSNDRVASRLGQAGQVTGRVNQIQGQVRNGDLEGAVDNGYQLGKTVRDALAPKDPGSDGSWQTDGVG